MRYGLPYRGSKSTIAEWVVDHLPSSSTLVDLFAGGCAITHAALLSGKYERIIANDLGDAPQVFMDAVSGEYAGYVTVPDREEFHAKKETDPAIALLYSFGNNRSDYLWGEKLEGVKVAASRMLTLPSVHERRMAYKEFIRALVDYGIPDKPRPLIDLQVLQRLEGLEGLEGLERLQVLQGLERLQGQLTISRLDYRLIAPPKDSVVYADPPYRNTGQDGYKLEGAFDYEAFDAWLQEIDHPVIVSEYTCPEGCVQIASKQKAVTMSSGSAKKAQEGLFIQERFKDWYDQTMREQSGRLPFEEETTNA